MNGVTYEGLAEFIYLDTLISNDNSVQKEIQNRILASNRTYFAAISLIRNRLLSRATKIRLYKTLIRPVVTYGAETWTMTKKEEQAILIFKGKYLEEYTVLHTYLLTPRSRVLLEKLTSKLCS